MSTDTRWGCVDLEWCVCFVFKCWVGPTGWCMLCSGHQAGVQTKPGWSTVFIKYTRAHIFHACTYNTAQHSRIHPSWERNCLNCSSAFLWCFSSKTFFQSVSWEWLQRIQSHSLTLGVGTVWKRIYLNNFPCGFPILHTVSPPTEVEASLIISALVKYCKVRLHCTLQSVENKKHRGGTRQRKNKNNTWVEQNLSNVSNCDHEVFVITVSYSLPEYQEAGQKVRSPRRCSWRWGQ